MIGLIIYLVGFLSTYILIKHIRNKQTENEWHDVLWTFVNSLLSWVSFISLLIAYVSKNNNTKPPKWL